MTKGAKNLNKGFRFMRFLEPRDWKVWEIDKKIKIITNTQCPVDDENLQIVCTFVGNNGEQKIRVGCCKKCGYFGYIDKLSRDEINNFYLRKWDKADSRNIEIEIQEKRKGVLKKDKDRKNDIIKFSKKFEFDKARPVLEIGSGYGGTLHEINGLGFDNVLGIEYSPHRAEIGSKAYGIKIISSPFENSKTQEDLRKIAPFGLIFSHHVLEHVYDPNEIIKLISNLQSDGDYLILSLPNMDGEFSMGKLMFFPHLHSFTRNSLEKLLNKHGYAICDDSLSSEVNLYVIARKDKEEILYRDKENAVNYFNRVLVSIEDTLGLNQNYSINRRRLWWDRRLNIGGQTRYFSTNLDKFYWPIKKILYRIKYRNIIIKYAGLRRWMFRQRKIQTALVLGLEKKYTNNSPIEIQFDGNVKLAYK